MSSPPPAAALVFVEEATVVAYVNPATPSPHPTSTICDDVCNECLARFINELSLPSSVTISIPPSVSHSLPVFVCKARRIHLDNANAVGHTLPQLGSASCCRFV